MSDRVITFYSYKGGTGRTMALANTAALLARNGSRVLVMDWDLEAPGVHRFLQPRETELDSGPGLIELFTEVAESLPKDPSDVLFWKRLLERHVSPTLVPDVQLVRAGRFDDPSVYAESVNSFDWSALHTRSPTLFRDFAYAVGELYDYVLIDSRTGVTDTSGICTTILPERLVVVFTPNHQSVDGVLSAVRQATTYRRRSDDLRPLLAFPLASRVELAEDDLRQRWREGDADRGLTGYQPSFERLFEDVYDLTKCDLGIYFDEVQIQHSTRFAYGEEIAVLSESGRDRLSLSRSYENFAGWLRRDEAPWMAPVATSGPTNDDDNPAGLVRLHEALREHARAEAFLHARERLLRSFQLVFAFVGTAGFLLLLLYDRGYYSASATPTAIITLMMLVLLEAVLRLTGTRERRIVHAKAALALRREERTWTTGTGAYKDGPSSQLLAERVEEIVAAAEDELVALNGSGRMRLLR